MLIIGHLYSYKLTTKERINLLIMGEFKPKLFTSLKNYTSKQFVRDVVAGIFVAIIAFPLSIALAISSGMRPEQGLYTAIIGGFFVSFFGGSRVQIGGATAATVTTVFTIVSKYDFEGLAITSIMAGIILIIMGIFKVGLLLKYIPYSITLGFTAGIGFGIFTGQIKEFLGLDISSIPVQNLNRIIIYAKNISTINLQTLLIGGIAIAILIIWPKLNNKIPNSLIAIIVTTLLVQLTGLKVNTIKSVYGNLPSNFPKPSLPSVSFELIEELFPSAFTLALLVAIVSLLSCVVTDGMTGHKHNSNTELIGEGIANIFCGIFSAVPVAGAVARSSTSVKNGGATPIVGIVHSIFVCIILLVMMPLAGYIPMATLAAILILVAYNMSNVKSIFSLIKTGPKSDSLVMLATFFTAIFINLMTAIEVGMILAALLFMKRMADVTEVAGWKYLDEDNDNEASETNDTDNISLKFVPENTLVFEINGPMFFAASEKFTSMFFDEKAEVLIIRMRGVPALDATALISLRKVFDKCKRYNVHLLFSHVNPQPMQVMTRSGFAHEVGLENFCPHIDDALAMAERIVTKKIEDI